MSNFDCIASFGSETYIEPDFYAGDDVETKDYLFPAGLNLVRGAVVSLDPATNEIVNDDTNIVGVVVHAIDTTAGATRAAILVNAKIIRSKLTVAGVAITDAQDAILRNRGIITQEAV